jgi:hypothetical protein
MQIQIGLMQKGRRPQRECRPPTSQLPPRDAAQLIVERRKQLMTVFSVTGVYRRTCGHFG